MDDRESAWEKFRVGNEVNPAIEEYARVVYLSGFTDGKAEELGGPYGVECGIAYTDSDIPVDPIRNAKAAEGIFNRYGASGDKLVERRVGPWTTIREKK